MLDATTPVTSDASVTVDTGRPAAQAFVDGKSIQVALEGAASTGSIKTDGTRIYDNALRGTSAAVRDTGSGVQLLAVLHKPHASATQRYAFDLPTGTSLVPTADGGVLIVGPDSVLSQVQPPWAKDANGRHVPTSYTVEGTTIVQRIDTSDAAFPVVADPKISFGRYIYVRFNPSERRELIATIAAAGGAVVGAALCARAGPIAAGVCSVLGAAAAIIVFQILYDTRWNRPECGLEVRVTYTASLHGWRLIRGDSSASC